MGFRPLRTGVTAQREAVGTPSGSGDATSVSARWPSGDDLPANVRNVAPSPAVDADAAPLQRLADLPSASTAGSQAMATPREIVFPPRDAFPAASEGAAATGMAPGIAGVQRQAAPGAFPGSLSLPPFSQGQSGPAGHAPPLSGAVPRGPLTLARLQGSAALAASSSPAMPVVARIVADATSPAAPRPFVQTSPAPSGGSTAEAFTAIPVVQRVDGAAPAPAAGEGRSDSELDELARALFGRIRSHLRAEVIHEREAKGLTFDAF
jgi:hypothetical protein